MRGDEKLLTSQDNQKKRNMPYLKRKKNTSEEKTQPTENGMVPETTRGTPGRRARNKRHAQGGITKKSSIQMREKYRGGGLWRSTSERAQTRCGTRDVQQRGYKFSGKKNGERTPGPLLAEEKQKHRL